MVKKHTKNRWVQVVATILLVALTYPLFEPDYGTGLDSSYVWGLNYLIDNDYNTLSNLIYPYGPLALLKLPTPYNGHFAIFLAFFTLIKSAFVFLTFEMLRRRGDNLLWSSLLMIPMCMIGNLDSFMVGCAAILVLSTIENGRIWPFAFAALLSGLALTIKLNIGLQCCSVLFVGWLIYIFIHRRPLKIITMAILVPVALIAVGMAVYHDFETLSGAATGALHLLSGYSSALVLEPEHKLWTLIVFAIIVILYPTLLRGKWARILYILLLIPLIANWKHGIVREDYTHFKNLAAFSSVMLTLVPLSMERFRLQPWVGSVVAMAMLTANIGQLGNNKLTTAAPANFANNIIHYSSTVDKSKHMIDSAYALRKLPKETLSTIGDGAVDCYPCEHIYAAANNLHWQPHATLEVGAGNSLWLNHKSAANFCGTEAVNFIILHPMESSGLRSLDGRYTLSDEPEIISTIIANYVPVDSGDFGLLLQRREKAVATRTDSLTQLNVHQDDWIKIPDIAEHATLKVSVSNSANLAGRIRSTIYKPDVCTIDYLMADSTIHTYRYSPATSEGGLWVSPLLLDFNDLAAFMSGLSTAEKPIAIRFKFTHPRCHKDEITLKFWVEELKY